MQRSARQGRIEDYLYISGPGLTVAQAAARLRVTERTIQRYRAELRARDVATGDAPLT
jgi:predicted DNA-binding transcriptional regulator YafY